jgi:CcmD family protein
MGDFNPIFVFIVYAVVWLVFFGYMFTVGRRQADVRADIESLRREIAAQRQQGRGGGPGMG